MASTSASRTRAPSLRTRALILLKASFYGVQVRRVGGQEHNLYSSRFDELPYPPWSVRPRPVEHHHLPLTKRGRQEEGSAPRRPLEGFRVGGPFCCGHGGAHGSLEGDRGDEGGVLLPRFLGTLP